MAVSTEGPAGYYTPPPPDAQAMSLSDHLRAALALIAGDRQITPNEMQEIQLFMAGLQEIGQQRQAALQPQVAPGDGQFDPGSEEDNTFGDESADDSLETEEPF